MPAMLILIKPVDVSMSSARRTRAAMGALVLAACSFLVSCSSNSGDAGSGPGAGSDSGPKGPGEPDAGGGRDSSRAPDVGVPDGSDSGRATDTGSDTGASSVATRPAYNTGDGFFVLDGKLYDPNGHEFIIRGSDRCHYDSDSQPALSQSKANTVRTFVGTNYGQTWAGLANIIQTQNIAYDEVPVITAASTTTGTATSCSTDTTAL